MSNREKITMLPGSQPDLKIMMAMVCEEYPGVSRGIVIVFDENGDMHTNFRCNDQEMALAGARLLHLANT